MSTGTRPLRRDAERNRVRILQAARETFATGGLSVTLDDIAAAAGVGVGTVYRRFPDKEALIDALFEERIAQIAEVAEAGHSAADPWAALVDYFEFGFAQQVADRGLKEVLLGSREGCSRVARARTRLLPAVTVLVERAHAAGVLRSDFTAQDIPVVMMMVSATIDVTRDVDPEFWRRPLSLLLDGLRADAAHPLPVGPLSIERLDATMDRWRPPRA